MNSLASRRAVVIDRKAYSDMGNYFINMVGQVRRINSVIAELVSPTDLKEHQTIETVNIKELPPPVSLHFVFIN